MKTIDRFALVGAPTGWFAGWAIMRLSGQDGPGAAWTIAHFVWIAALMLFGTAAIVIHRLVTKPRSQAVGPVSLIASRAGAFLAVGGAVALIAQMIIDLTVGFVSSRYQSVFNVPGVELVIYQIAPGALFVGLVGLAAAAATQHRVVTSAAVLMVAGTVTSALGHGAPGGFRAVEGVGMLLIVVAMARVMRTPRYRGTHTRGASADVRAAAYQSAYTGLALQPASDAPG
jgi:hypothetical protein